MPSPTECVPARGCWWCDACDEKLLAPRDDSYRCQHTGCDHQELCLGCIYECAACRRDFCPEHITETKLANDHALYACAACLRKSGGAKEAA